jgi:hypothetical protein
MEAHTLTIGRNNLTFTLCDAVCKDQHIVLAHNSRTFRKIIYRMIVAFSLFTGHGTAQAKSNSTLRTATTVCKAEFRSSQRSTGTTSDAMENAYVIISGQTIHEDKKQKKVDKEQHQLNEHRERLNRRENNLDSKERVVRRNQRRLNIDQKAIDKQRPVNNTPKAK